MANDEKPLAKPLISVIGCAHNEEEYVDKSVLRMLNALKVFNFEIVFVTDRCMDGTVERMRKYGEFGVKVVEKNWKKWANRYSESL